MDQPQSTSTPESLALRLRAMINSNWITQALYVTAQLGLPDVLASGPQTSESLAQATGMHAPSLHRLLRALVTIDIVRERAEGAFALLPLGALLQRNAATSLRSWAILVGGYHWQAWGHLLDSVKTGESAHKLLTGTDVFPDLEQHPELAALFDQAMVESTRLIVQAVVQAYDFAGSGGSSMWEEGTGSCSWPSSQPTRRRTGCSSIGRTPSSRAGSMWHAPTGAPLCVHGGRLLRVRAGRRRGLRAQGRPPQLERRAERHHPGELSPRDASRGKTPAHRADHPGTIGNVPSRSGSCARGLEYAAR